MLAEHGSTITTTMYRRLFEDEHIRALFNHSNQGEGGAQVHALAAAILGYAQNIDNLGALAPTVERIAHKHVGYHILPEHYCASHRTACRGRSLFSGGQTTALVHTIAGLDDFELIAFLVIEGAAA